MTATATATVTATATATATALTILYESTKRAPVLLTTFANMTILKIGQFRK
jgi:hypothetical protein